MAYSTTQFQLTDLLQGVYDKLEQTKGLLATGGSTTTIIDTTISDGFQDDAFNGYTAFVNYDAGGAAAAPQGEYKRVTDYVASTTTLTTAAFSTAIAAGDYVTIARGSLFPLNDVIRLCNSALRGLGDIPDVDTSITTAANQTEHNVPTGVVWNRIVKAEIQGITTDANDNRYREIPFKVVPPTTPGGTATIVFDQHPSGYTIRLTWVAPHPFLADYDDVLSDAIHPELAVAACAYACADWKRDAVENDILPKTQAYLQEARAMHPPQKFIKKVRGMPRWSSDVPEDRVPSPITT